MVLGDKKQAGLTSNNLDLNCSGNREAQFLFAFILLL